MIVGVARVELALTDIGSLKDKRSIVKPLVLKLTNRYDVQAAEVEAMDDHGSAVVGLCRVGNDQRFVNAVISKAVDFLEKEFFEGDVVSVETEFLEVL